MKIGAWMILLLLAESASAQPLGVGDRIESFSLADQHGASRSVDETVAVLLFSRDMDGGDVLKQALADVPPDWLSSRDAVYVADISAMPAFVARLFAIPSMRRRPYPMLLDRRGEATARLPDVAGNATLLFLDDLEIVRVLYLTDPVRVRAELAAAATGGD